MTTASIHLVSFDEERDIVDRKATRRGAAQYRPGARLDLRVSDGVETRDSLVRPRATEHTRCEERAIQTAVLPDEVVSELPRDLG